MAEQTRSGRIKRMPEWYSFKKSEKDLIADLCGGQRDLYGYRRYSLTQGESEDVMGFGGEFLDDTADPDGRMEELYIETMRRAYREEFWEYMDENGSGFFSF